MMGPKSRPSADGLQTTLRYLARWFGNAATKSHLLVERKVRHRLSTGNKNARPSRLAGLTVATRYAGWGESYPMEFASTGSSALHGKGVEVVGQAPSEFTARLDCDRDEGLRAEHRPDGPEGLLR